MPSSYYWYYKFTVYRENINKLTLKSTWINNVNGTGYSDTNANLAHITKALSQFW